MNLKDYFENTKGIGVLSTSNLEGQVNAAVYARPHIMDEGKAAFIMADKLTHNNLLANPYACYIFKQEGKGYTGKRLYLKKIEETDEQEKIDKLRRSCHCCCDEGNSAKKFLVTFAIEKERPLIGDGKKTKDICTTCLAPTGESGHMCLPITKKDKKCDWCGALIPDERHLCNEKIKELKFICNSCGRTAIESEHLCAPSNIE